MVKMVPRGFTAAADAYLTPHILRYLATFRAGFDAGLDAVGVLFMQSDGGLAPAGAFSGHRAILSGPAGGYVGYALTTRWCDAEEGGGAGGGALHGDGGGACGAEQQQQQQHAKKQQRHRLLHRGVCHDGGPSMQVIGFDMGGTSTDVSRFAGTYEHVFETTTAGVTIQAPQLDINTVAAGGGSRLHFRAGLFAVGPDSAGAHPGPVCYKKAGGRLAVTDANLALGRILPEFFPRIFGPGEVGGGWAGMG